MNLLKSLKTGDKVRLKRLENWVTARDSALTVKHVGEFSTEGVAFGALCEWITAQGKRLEKIYPLDDLTPA